MFLAARTTVFTIWVALGRVASAMNVASRLFWIVATLPVFTTVLTLLQRECNQESGMKLSITLNEIYKNTAAYRAYLRLVKVNTLKDPG